MKTVTPLDLRRSLGRLLDEASAGERILVTRDHRPLAVIVSVEDAARLDEPADQARRRRLAAIAALEEYRDRIVRQLGARPPERTAAAVVRELRDALDERDRRRASGDLTASTDL